MARMTGAPLFSPKGAIGDHGSVGLTNVAAAALCLSSGTVPPMPSLEQPREEYPFTYPREPLRGPRRRALILGVARGGATPTVILDAWR
jgi:3-oxoacyl-(acyl-carrier-protein) synthase